MADFEVNRRLKKIIVDVYKVSPVEFSKKYNDPKAVKTYNIISERNGVSKNMLDEILGAYPEINRTWLLTGEGEMLKETSDNEKIAARSNDNFRLVPMYNIDARGGFGDNDEVNVAEYIMDYIPFKDAKVDDICVPVIGNSMSPTYCAGSVVLLHRIERWQEFLELGQVYMIVLTDGRRIIKELRASKEDKRSNYLCVSHNPDFEPVELPKNMINAVFLVRAVYAKTSM